MIKYIKEEFSKAPLWQQYLLIGLVIILVFLGLKKTVLSSVFGAYSKTMKKNIYLKQNIQTAKIIEKDIPVIEKKHAQLKKNFYTKVNSSLKVPIWLKQITPRAIDIVSIKPLKIIEQDDIYNKEQFEVIVVSTLSSFQWFIKNWQNATFFGDINNFEISKSNNNKYRFKFKFTTLTSDKGKLKRAKQKKKIHSVKAKKETIILQGFWKGEDIKALINGQLVGVGDYIDGYRIINIQPTRKYVVVEKNGKEKRLKEK